MSAEDTDTTDEKPTRKLPRTAWKPGQCGNPLGGVRPENRAKRNLSLALRELVSDEEIGGWLLALIAGRDPFAKKRRENADALPSSADIPLDWTHRMAAMRMLLERRDGMPMQAIALKAELDLHTHAVANASDRIDVTKLSDASRDALENDLRLILGQAPVSLTASPSRLTPPIDAEYREVDEKIEISMNPSAPAVAPPSMLDILDEEHVDAVAPVHVDPADTIELKFPHSGNVSSAKLDLSSGVVEVSFHSPTGPKVYAFGNFTPKLMDEWRAAESAGAWFNREVRCKNARHPMLRKPGGSAVTLPGPQVL